MKFKKKSASKPYIPTASLPDIIFLLLIFFMVTTVLKRFTGLQVSLPPAEAIEKLESRVHVSYIWIASDGSISLDDKIVPRRDISAIGTLMYDKRVADPMLIVSLKIDKEVEMSDVNLVQEQLRRADALRVNYATLFKKTN
ncbi:MAG: biopolymer transporter ExbD [Candidatus Helarchaeota archaeon]|nr:biopolymer transporter ExbD [Candidatus Helarchaeota archaeon]